MVAHLQKTIDGTRSAINLLYQITMELQSPERDLQGFIEAVLGHLAVFGMERCVITLVNPDTHEVRIEASRGLSDEEQSRGSYRVGEGVIGQVIERGEAVVIPSVGDEPLFLDRTRSRTNLDARQIAFIAVPIRNYRREVVGTLSVDRWSAPSWVLEDDLHLLTVVSGMLGEAAWHWREERAEAESRVRELIGADPAAEVSGHMVGSSRQMRGIFQMVAQVASSDTTVLLRGESGTGKELVAAAIHEASRRVKGPFVSVNCGALPEQLVESELFGHVRGAYTGAVGTRRGRFELADRGTIFLDEIADLPLNMQVKLLRVLQEREIHPVGGERPRHVDVRIIAATNASLEDLIETGGFREDLYYRLNVFPIYLPALRERRTDITLLADHFVEKYAKAQNRKVLRISTPAIELMMAYHWPGNVRELENCVARAVLLSEDGVVRAHHLPPSLQTGSSSGTTSSGSLDGMMAAYEREILIEAMKDAAGNITRAAEALATTHRILSYRLRKHDLHGKLVKSPKTRRGSA